MVATHVKTEIGGAWRNSEAHTEKSLIDLVRIKETDEESIDVYQKKVCILGDIKNQISGGMTLKLIYTKTPTNPLNMCDSTML